MSTEAVPCMFKLAGDDGSLKEITGFLIRELPQAISNGPQPSQPQSVASNPPVTAILLPAPGGSYNYLPAPSGGASIQLLPTTTGQKPSTSMVNIPSATGKSRPNSLTTQKPAGKKAPLHLQPKPVGGVTEPIQIATKVLLPVTTIQPILVAETTPVVQQTGSFQVEVDHGQQPSCSVWSGFQGQSQPNHTYQIYTTTSTTYESITQPTVSLTQMRISTGDEKIPPTLSQQQQHPPQMGGINSVSSGYSPMKPPASGLHEHIKNNNTSRKANQQQVRSSFDSPSPSQVVPQMNTDPYDHSIASTPSSGSYLPPINSIAPSSNGSLISSHSPDGSDSSHGTSTSYHHQQPAILNFVASTISQNSHNTPSGSVNGANRNDSTSSSVDAMDDLNSIDMNQLISNSTSISTEQYLAVHSAMPSNYQEQPPNSHTGYQNGVQPVQYVVTQVHTGPPPPVIHSHTTHIQAQPNGTTQVQPCIQYSNSQDPQYGVQRPQTTHTTYQQHSTGSYPAGSWIDPNQPQQHPSQPPPPLQQAHYTRVGYGHQPASHMSSSTPDSGIQSIDGSPPSTSAFTPPMMVSPYAAQSHIYETTLNSGNRNTLLQPVLATTSTTQDDDDICDFSDMPTLIPVNQMTHEDEMSDAPPVITPIQSSQKIFEPGSTSSIPKRPSMDTLEAITPMDVEMGPNTDVGVPKKLEAVEILTTGGIVIDPDILNNPIVLAEHLKKHFDPSMLKQIAGTLLQPEPVTIQASEINSIPPLDYVDQAQPSTSFELPAQPPLLPSFDFQIPSSMRIDTQNLASSTSEPNEKIVDSEPEIDENAMVRILEYREKSRAKMQSALKGKISNLESLFADVNLEIGKSVHLPLPWQHMDWKRIADRLTKNGFLGEKTRKSKKVDEKRRKRKSNESGVKHEGIEIEKKKEKVMENEKIEKTKKNERKSKRNEDDGKTSLHPSLKITIVRRDSEISIKSSDSEKNGRIEKVEKMEKTTKKDEKVRSRSRSLKDDYIKIRSNVVINQPNRHADPEPCWCTAANPCTSTSSCTHRPLRYECTSITCRLHSQCANRRIQNNESLINQLQIFTTPNKGLGVRSKEDVKIGQYLCEFVGEVVKKETYDERMGKRTEEMRRFGIDLVAGYVVDATKKGNISRFMNHGCEPNCEMQKWIVNGQYRLAIFAKQDIPAGHELTYDYFLHASTIKPPQKCICGSPKCKNFIPSAAKPTKKLKLEQLSKTQIEKLREKHVFLPRNLKKWSKNKKIKGLKPLVESELSELLVKIFTNFANFCQEKEKIPKKRIIHLNRSIKHVFRLASSRSANEIDLFLLERFDAAVKTFIQLLAKLLDKRRWEAIKSYYTHVKRQTDLSRFSGQLTKDSILGFHETPKTNFSSPKKEKKIVSREADLSYMDSTNPVGSYDPDKEAKLKCAMDSETDCVRCVCGIMEDDGEEVQCDKCKFWVHIDCVNRHGKLEEDFICPFCTDKLKSTPPVDIILTPQPEMKFKGCTYYRTLVNARGIQVRVNEAVYVERLINDKHKLILKKLHEECAKPLPGRKKDKNKDVDKNTNKSDLKGTTLDDLDDSKQDLKKEYHRKDLRTFRVERLFMSPNGQRFVFGCYYARPHETFCDPSRMFYKNELFWTPLFDTLPLDAVAGRCLILDPAEWVKGRPKSPKYLEEDVFICEYQIDKNQRSFEKINAKNKYNINTDRYVFDEFHEKLALKRNFTPFVLPAHHQPKIDKHDAKDRVETLSKKTSAEHLAQLCVNLPLHASLPSTSGHKK